MLYGQQSGLVQDDLSADSPNRDQESRNLCLRLPKSKPNKLSLRLDRPVATGHCDLAIDPGGRNEIGVLGTESQSLMSGGLVGGCGHRVLPGYAAKRGIWVPV